MSEKNDKSINKKREYFGAEIPKRPLSKVSKPKNKK